MDIEVGQVLSLRIRFNNSGDISTSKHPYLVVGIDTTLGIIEVAQIDSLRGKEYKAAFRSNKTILSSNPSETVIDKDSYVQMDNKFTLEYYDGIVRYRRQKDKLSNGKLEAVIAAYREYQQEHHLNEDKIVYMTKEEIETLNN